MPTQAVRRAFRPLARLLVLLLVPVLLVTTPGVARAAVTDTPTVGVTWLLPGVVYGYGDIECSASVTGSYIQGVSAQFWFENVDCWGSTDLSPGTAQPGEEGSTATVWVTGTNCGGSGTDTFVAAEGDGLLHTHGVIDSVSYYAGPDTCDPATACIKLSGSGSSRSLCTPVLLDPPAQGATEGCAYGKPFTPTLAAPVQSGNYATVKIDFPIELVENDGLGDTKWYWYSLAQVNGGTGRANAGTGSATPPAGGGTTWTLTGTAWPGDWGDAGDKLTGIGLYRVVPGESATFYSTTGVWNGSGGGVLGATDPATCRFYWGEKIATDPVGTTEEPLGPLPGGGSTTPVPPVEDPAVPAESEGCTGFSLTDPTSWASAGICALVGLFVQLIELVGDVLGALWDLLGLVAGLVEAIGDLFLDMLKSLFMPDPAAMQAKTDELKAAIQDSEVGTWQDAYDAAFSDAAAAPSSGVAAKPLPSVGGETAQMTTGGDCMGPSITWDGFGDAGLNQTFHPIAACSGVMAELAGWCRLLLMVVVGVGATTKILEMIMVSLGFFKQTHVMLSADWGNDHTVIKR